MLWRPGDTLHWAPLTAKASTPLILESNVHPRAMLPAVGKNRERIRACPPGSSPLLVFVEFPITAIKLSTDDFFSPKALADYIECVKNPETIRSICEDYRAAASIDLKDDDISRKQNLKIKMPTLVLWGKKGKIEQWYDPLTIWQKYCDQEVRGYGVNTGHYLAEENPDEIIKSINNFFK